MNKTKKETCIAFEDSSDYICSYANNMYGKPEATFVH